MFILQNSYFSRFYSPQWKREEKGGIELRASVRMCFPMHELFKPKSKYFLYANRWCVGKYTLKIQGN